jgi:hypothetical protein
MQIWYKFCEKFLQSPKVLNLGNKFIPNSVYREDMLGFVDIRLNLLAQSGNVVINGSGGGV